MGRPLKIAKAQAILTITGTDATTEEVTVSQTLASQGVIAGMPFVVASNVGGLIAGTTYWILQVTGASTFTVSANQLSANPTFAKVDLSGTTGQSVATSVGVVDYGFNNPAGITNTYGVVGGNTAIYGNQVLARIAIGINGTGTVFASTSSNVVVGLGTDFANLTTGTTLFAIWGAGAGPTQLLGTTTATKGNLLVGVANTTATGNVIGTVGNAQTLTVNTPVTFDATFGGLTAGTTYFVKTIANAAAFTVAEAPNGDPVQLTSNASVTGNAIQNRVVLTAVSANNALGVTGYGDPYVSALSEPGFIVRQKGKQKYLVQGATTGLIAQCQTANLGNTALTPNTMNILATYANSGTAYVQSLSDINLEIFGNDAPMLQNANPAYATFNAAQVANVDNGQPFPLVSIRKA